MKLLSIFLTLVIWSSSEANTGSIEEYTYIPTNTPGYVNNLWVCGELQASSGAYSHAIVAGSVGYLFSEDVVLTTLSVAEKAKYTINFIVDCSGQYKGITIDQRY